MHDAPMLSVCRLDHRLVTSINTFLTLTPHNHQCISHKARCRRSFFHPFQALPQRCIGALKRLWM